jgi:hypothetical protein
MPKRPLVLIDVRVEIILLLAMKRHFARAGKNFNSILGALRPQFARK